MPPRRRDAARRVPELAVVVAAVLVGGLLVFLLAVDARRFLEPAFGASVLATVLVLSYPFLWYAVAHDEDPTNVFPPRAVAVSGVVLGIVAVALGVAGGVSWTPLLATAAALPPMAYGAAYTSNRAPVPPLAVLVVAAEVVLALAAATAFGPVRLLVAATTAALVGGGAGAYDRRASGLRSVDDPVLVGIAVVAATTVVLASLRGGSAAAMTALLIAGAAVGGGIVGAVLIDRRDGY